MILVAIYRTDETFDYQFCNTTDDAEEWIVNTVNKYLELDCKDIHDVREAECDFGNEPDKTWFKNSDPVSFAVDILQDNRN